MEYLEVDPKEFADFYDLDTSPRRCPRCGQMPSMCMPFRFDSDEDGLIVGLRAKEHKCGPDYAASTMACADPKKRAEWVAFFEAV